MSTHGVADPIAIGFETSSAAEPVFGVPRYVAAALQHVCLCREKTTPPVAHRGEFWYWQLTPFGLDLMRALVRASVVKFSYCETFLEREPDTIPQLVLLGQLSASIGLRLADDSCPLDWAAVLDHSPFLRDRQVVIDTPVFQREMDHLITRIRQGCYELSGDRIYRYPPQARTLKGRLPAPQRPG